MNRSRVKSVVTLALAVVLFDWRILLTRQFSLLTDAESVNQAYCWLTWWVSSLRHGVLPLWDPYVFGGRSFPGEMQTAAFYPLHLLLYAAPLGRDGLLSPQAYHIYIALTHFLAACFMFALARALRLRRFPALVAGLCFALGGFTGRVTWPHLLESSIWLPLAFLCLLRALRADRQRQALAFAAACGLALGMAILAGGLHIALMQPIVILSAVLYAALHAEACGLPRGWGAWKRAVLVAGAAIAVALAAGAIQLLPSMEYSARSIRFIGATALPATEKIPYAYLRDGMAPNSLVMFLLGQANGFMGSGDISNPYLGVFPLLLAAIGIRRRWRRPFVPYLTGLAAAAFLFCLGSFSLLHGVLYAVAPWLWMAREAGRFVYLTDFALAILAGFGAEMVFDAAAKAADWTGWLRLAKWASLAAAVVLIVPALFGKPDLNPWTALSMILILASCLLFRLIVRGEAGGWARAAAIALLLFDLSAFDWTARNKLDVARQGENHLDRLLSCRGAVAFLRSRPGPFRVQVLPDPAPNIGDAFHIPAMGGAAVTMPNNFSHLMRLGPRAAALLNVRYLVRPASAAEPGSIYADTDWKVYENPLALPRAWIVHQSVVEPSSDRLIGRLAAPETAPDRVALTAEPLEATLAPAEGAPDAVGWEGSSADRIEFTARTAANGLLVIGEMFYPGWEAAVNGRPVRIHEVDGGLRGIVVPPGVSRIRLRYRPRWLAPGLTLTAAAFVGTLLFFLSLWWVDRRAYRAQQRLVMISGRSDL